MTQSQLCMLQNASVDSCDPSTLTDIRTISVNGSQPVSQRMTDFLEAIGNPYLFRVGEVVVKVKFNPSGKRFSEAVSDALCAK